MTVNITYGVNYTSSSPVDAVFEFVWSSVELGITNALLMSWNEVGLAPRTGYLYNPSINITWSPGGANYSLTFTYEPASIALFSNGITTLNTSTVTYGPYNVPIDSSSEVTLNFHTIANANATPPSVSTDPGSGIIIKYNNANVGVVNSINNSTFTYALVQETVNITYTIRPYLFAPTTTIMDIIVYAPALLPSSSTFTVQIWNVDIQSAVARLVINDFTISYEPTSLNSVAMSINIPIGGLTWFSSGAPAVPNSNAAPFNQVLNMTFQSTKRTINTVFLTGGYLTGGVTLQTAGSLEIESGATVLQVPAVPSVLPTSITIAPFCIHPDSMVHTTEGLKRLGDLKSSSDIQLIDFEQNLIPMLHVAQFVGSEFFVKYSKDSIGPNSPSTDLFVTEGHPILFKQKEIVSKRMINNDSINLVHNPTNFTYALVTEKRTFTLINNVPVCTWSPTELKAFAKKAGVYYRLI
jgi:hypothetical protein